MRSRRLATLAVFAGALFAPDADATTITLGPHELPSSASTSYSCNVLGPCETGFTLAQLSSPGLVDVAPASGMITSWRIRGSGSPHLHVLRPAGEGEWAGAGVTGVAADQSGGPNAAGLPIHAGDLIGVDLPESGGLVRYQEIPGSGAEVIRFTPIVEEGVGQYEEFSGGMANKLLLLSAEVVLAPLVSSVAPASGAGGETVKIFGQYLDGATGVSFGAAPAQSFSVDSANQITAIAPASAPSTVDVRVTGPGGSSEVSAADRYTFTAPATTPGASPSTLLAPPPGGPVAKPAVSGLDQSSSRWRRGKGLPRISRAGGAPVGTIFSFTLNEPATASFAFTRRAPGRRVKGRCVAVTPANAGKAKCKRTVSAGSFSLAAHAGPNKVSFQGRVSSSKTLKPGTYGLILAARDARGLKAASRPLSFTIVPG